MEHRSTKRIGFGNYDEGIMAEVRQQSGGKPRVRYVCMNTTPQGEITACPFRSDALWEDLVKLGIWQFIIIGRQHAKEKV
jgi:hypothetical protein